MRQVTVGTGSQTASVSALALGTLWFGTKVDEETSFALLDRFTEAGGTLIDTANEYAYWEPGAGVGEAEKVIGRWQVSRKARDRVALSTKVGAAPNESGAMEGLSATAIKAGLAASLSCLQTDHLDIYWAHDEDRATPLEETVAAFGGLVDDGTVRVLGVSNHAVWRVERARGIAAAAGVPGWSVLQYRHSYLQPRPDTQNPERSQTRAEHLDLAASAVMALFAYTPLLKGAYNRDDVEFPEAYDHPGSTRRIAALREVAQEVGATPSQVVLAWLMGSPTPIIPIVGASSVAQLDESLATVDIQLDAGQRERLDAAK
jgi:aryl-alcohol dehydrogenase-like predicted oxidoreductase